jgi:formylmethanofuran--tetrahydromethanopterin N-formyltransferase
MDVAGVPVEDTFAEAFPLTGCRVIVTALDLDLARTAGVAATGYACSVIGCDAEAGIERELSPDETPDGRPGVALLFFGFSRDGLAKAVVNRVGQCIMTCPTTACFSGLAAGDRAINVGGQLRYFGDGRQISKLVDERRFWRIPVMDGEFVIEESFGTAKGVGGGNLLLAGRTTAGALTAARAAAIAMRAIPGVILPFPGGLVRSGSKVGSRYRNLKASTNDAWCPSLTGVVKTELPEGAEAVYELVIDGLDEASVRRAMTAGMRAAATAPGADLVRISAGNYGGTLGPIHLKLRDLIG